MKTADFINLYLALLNLKQ